MKKYGSKVAFAQPSPHRCEYVYNAQLKVKYVMESLLHKGEELKDANPITSDMSDVELKC